MSDTSRQALSGKDSKQITVDAAVAGELSLDDLRIHPDTLEYQATQANDHANPQLAANFRRAAELTRLSDEEVLGLYDMLRPFRATPQELADKGEELTARGLPLVGELFHEAAGVYERRHLGA